MAGKDLLFKSFYSMLKRKYRLPVRANLAHSSSRKSQTFRLMISQNNLTFSRFGFVVSKKVDKRSVVRNRTKRVLRSCIEEMREKIIEGYDMLFILQKNAVGQKKDAFCNEINKLFTDMRLVK
jgi:ribonuclease P protein component